MIGTFHGFQGIEQYAAEQFTGVRGAGGYRDAAAALGYEYLIVYDATATSGEWAFLVSKDDKEWYWLYQHSAPFGEGITYEIGGLAVTVEADTSARDILVMVEEDAPW